MRRFLPFIVVAGTPALKVIVPVLLVATATLAAAVNAAADDETSRQRADIAAERQAVQRRFVDKERDCQQRFVVTSCLNAAQKERRDALAPLRQEEIRIDTLQRKQRAAARLEDIEEKQRADAAKESAASAAKPAAAHPPASTAAPRPADPITRPSLRAPIGDQERQRREEASLARFQANQAAAQQRREAADARNAKRAGSGKVARPLPAPDGASAP